MKFKFVQGVAAAAAVLLIAGCGGGGGGSSPTPSLELSGTAATGAALSGATVQVKCAGGSGTGTTTTTGSYTISIEGGTLPCIIQVSGTAGGVAVTLHSVTESGTTDNGTKKTSAVANVTPITEMIVAQLTAALPSDSFGSFDASKVTATTVASAATAIVNALKSAGVDLGSIDPLKATLVPANGTTAGNAYDKLLDVLASKVPPESLPQVVSQIATAAVTQSTGGLTQAMTAVSGGFLEGCPAILSGKCRTLDLFGKTVVRDIDFAKKTFTAVNGDLLTITTDSAKPCEFTVTGTSDGKDVAWEVVMGANGVGSYRARFTNPASAGTNGYIFPAQSHAVSAVAGTWSFLQSGYTPDDGLVHSGGQLTVNASNGTVGVCDYDPSDWSCMVEADAGLTVSARADGGFDLNASSQNVARLYGYKAPNGAFAVFGTTNAAGASDSTVEQTSLIASKLTAATVPALNTVTKYWDVSYNRYLTTTTALAPTADSHTVIGVDGSTVMRKRVSDGREDTVHYNSPLAGMRTRDAGVWNDVPFAKVYQVPLQGLGVTVSVNAFPASSSYSFIHNISVIRP